MEHIFMQQELLSFENMHTSNGKFAPTHFPLLPEYELRTTNIHGYLYLYPRGHPRAPAGTIQRKIQRTITFELSLQIMNHFIVAFLVRFSKLNLFSVGFYMPFF
jgi:hypothetical protein